MRTLLDAIATELEERRAIATRLDDEIARLLQMRTAAEELAGVEPTSIPGPPPAPVAELPAPRAPRAPARRELPPAPRRRGEDAAELERKITSALLNHPGGLSKAVLVEKTGRTPSAVKTALTKMFGEGKI